MGGSTWGNQEAGPVGGVRHRVGDETDEARHDGDDSGDSHKKQETKRNETKEKARDARSVDRIAFARLLIFPFRPPERRRAAAASRFVPKE